jgi:Lon protease-like protein
MLPIEVQIERAQRLVKMLEQDAPLLAARVADLTPEYQQSAKSHAALITDCARAELQRLMAALPQAARAKRARTARQN